MMHLDPLEEPEPMGETALLRRRPTVLRWDTSSWTVGIEWHAERAQLVFRPLPCVAVEVHLPGRRTRVGALRWLRAHAVFFVMTMALSIATTFGFIAGRVLPTRHVAPLPSMSAPMSTVYVETPRIAVAPPSASSVSSAPSADMPAPAPEPRARTEERTRELQDAWERKSQYERYGAPPWDMKSAPSSTASTRRSLPRAPDPYDSRF